MTICIPLACSLVAVAAAVRSTWSPCGLSMLSTITPFGERARGHSYGATSAWFVAGATVGGASLGLLMAASALAVRELHPTETVVGVVALAAALVAVVSDAGVGRLRLPFHRRQVNERWLDHFRPSVYGMGFGWQIGTGLATYITTAAVYLMIVLGALSGRPGLALTVGTGFGMFRGSAVLLTHHVSDPSGLRAFHRRFSAVGAVVDRIVLGVELGSAVLVALWLRSLCAGVVVTVVAIGVTTALIRSDRPYADTSGAPACPVPTAEVHGDASLAATGGVHRPG